MDVIEIPSSPDPLPCVHFHPPTRNHKGRKRSSRHEDVIELTEPESDEEAGSSGINADVTLQSERHDKLSVPHSNDKDDFESEEPLFIPGDEDDRPTNKESQGIANHDLLQTATSGSVQIPEIDFVSLSVTQVREIIPDVDPDHVLALVEQDVHEDYGGDIVQHVLHTLFENPTYPRVAKNKGKRKAEEELLPEKEKKKAKLDYFSLARDYVGGEGYDELTLNQLQVDFPLIPKPYVRQALHIHKLLYAPTYIFLRDLEKRYAGGDTNLPYVHKATPYRPKGKNRMLQNAEFQRELEWVIEQTTNPEGLAASQQDENVEAVNEDVPFDDGEGIECGCCFTEYAFSDMVQCPEAHLFCKSCMRTYCSNMLGEHNPAIVCMHQSGCKLPFPVSELQRFLPAKLMSLYERVRQQKEIEAANLEGLEECPFCEWKCVFDVSKEEDKLFRCGNEDGGCGVVSCRECKKLDHLPKNCKEADEDRHLDGRHAIEEAMSRALVRNCPKCQKAFIKESGCNKMICPNCHTMSCYVCRQVINGYDHFNQAPRGHPQANGMSSKCLLWEVAEERHVDDVKAAAEKAIGQYKLDNPDVDEKDIKVDLPVAPLLPLRPGMMQFAPQVPFAPQPQFYPYRPHYQPNPLVHVPHDNRPYREVIAAQAARAEQERAERLAMQQQQQREAMQLRAAQRQRVNPQDARAAREVVDEGRGARQRQKQRALEIKGDIDLLKGNEQHMVQQRQHWPPAPKAMRNQGVRIPPAVQRKQAR